MSPVRPGKARTKAKTHTFALDPTVPGFCRCGLAYGHVSHNLPPTTEDQAAADARLLGERED